LRVAGYGLRVEVRNWGKTHKLFEFEFKVEFEFELELYKVIVL